ARVRKDEHALPAAPKIDLTAAGAKAKEGGESLGVAFTTAAEVISTAWLDYAKKAQATLDGVSAQLKAQDEELEMLWWLIGSRSTSLDCAFSDISPTAAPFILATEL